MKTFFAFLALLAVASAQKGFAFPIPSLNQILAAVSNQFHTQDGKGQYAYGYNDLLSSKQEIKSPNGITRGSYSYIDSNNHLQTVNYIADANGFRVVATNLPKSVEAPVVPHQDLPKQVEDTFEVAAAKSAHFAAIEEAKKQNGYQVPEPEVLIRAPIELPRPVEDTPEVAKAKAEHLNAIEQAKLRNSYQKIDSGIKLVQSAPLPLVASPISYSAYSSVPFPGGFSYSSNAVNSPVVQYVRYL